MGVGTSYKSGLFLKKKKRELIVKHLSAQNNTTLGKGSIKVQVSELGG